MDEFKAKYPLLKWTAFIWASFFVVSISILVLFLFLSDSSPPIAHVLVWLSTLGIASICAVGFAVQLIHRLWFHRLVVAYGNGIAYVDDGCEKHKDALAYLAGCLSSRDLFDEAFSYIYEVCRLKRNKPEIVFIVFQPEGDVEFFDTVSGYQRASTVYISWDPDNIDYVLSLLGHEMAHVVLWSCSYKGDHHELMKKARVEAMSKALGWSSLGGLPNGSD